VTCRPIDVTVTGEGFRVILTGGAVSADLSDSSKYSREVFQF